MALHTEFKQMSLMLSAALCINLSASKKILEFKMWVASVLVEGLLVFCLVCLENLLIICTLLSVWNTYFD